MPGLRNRLILLLLICLISSSVVSGIEIVGNIEESATWTASNSPYIINDVTTIESDVLLTIESGVIVKFGTGAGFIIDGLLHARGTETDSIVFTSLDAAEPGTWGGLLFSGGSDEELWDSDDQFSGEGSILDHCILEYGGGSSEFSSVVSVTFSSLYITNSLIQNCLGETGTIHCGNISKLMIEKSKVINNTADLGGAISLGLGTFSVIRDNIFVQNSARDKGGAIYLTRGETKLNRNSFLLNEAANYGGAIYIAGSQNILLENNVLLGNKSGFGAQTLGIQDDVNIKITGNIFAQTKNAICLRNAVNDVEATENFWGRKDTTDFRQFILDRNQNAREPYVNYHPMLLAPIENIHTNPVEVISIHLCRDDTYTSDIPRGVANGAPMRIRLDAVTVNPYTPDLIRVKVVSTLDPEGVLIPLVETDANSGIFIGRGEIALDSDEEMFTIGDEIGGIVTIFAPFYPDVKAEYATMSAKPLVENYAILETPDSLHLINHNPTFIWDYFEVVERPQTNYRFRVYEINEDGLVSEAIHWDSKETPSEYHNIHYKGTELEDGQTYLAKLKVFSSYLWSDSYDMLFRMNSLPTPPVAQRPAHDELTITVKPELVAATSIDRETDSLVYDFKIFHIDDPNTVVQYIENLPPLNNQALWIPHEDLIENAGYEFQVRAVDPFEPGPFSEKRQFWINSLEEHAADFDLSLPENESTIYPLHPLLKWTEAIDPDPLSSVKYHLALSMAEDFTDSLFYDDIIPLEFRVPDSLDNRQTWFWRVISIDNTGLTKASSSVFSFYVETTPTVPVASFPMEGEERLHTAELSWKASSDPNPDDKIMYDVEVFDSPDSSNKVAEISSLDAIAISIQNLSNWETLIDNKVYYWHVRSRDNHNADSKYSQGGSFFYNRYNDAPNPVPEVTAPADTVMGSNVVKFTWDEASDIDQSDTEATMIYEVEATLSDFESNDIRRFESKPGELQVVNELDDNRLWFYRVRVRDDEGAVSTWSAQKSVLVNVAEDPPTDFILQQPINDKLIVELDSLTFKWQSSSDPDWESSIKYKLEIFPAEGETFEVLLDKTSYTYYEGLTNESSYRWKVTAIDNIGLETGAESEFRITTNTTPTAPSVAQMPEELLLNGLLTWNGATDPNPVDQLKYIVEIDADAGFDTPLIHVEDFLHQSGVMNTVIGELSGSDILIDDKDYYFRVQAFDNHGYHGAFFEPHKLRFNRENDNPGITGSPYTPTGDIVVRTQSPSLSWSEATDVDLSDPSSSLFYDLRLDSDGELIESLKFEFTTSQGASKYRIPVPLTDNTPWVWQVRTRDNEGAVSDWSPMQSMLVNVKEDAPTQPTPFKPYAAQKLNILGPIEFEWNKSIDPDYMSSISYKLEYSASVKFADSIVIEKIDSTKIIINGPLENTTYYWRLIAIDNTGLETVSNISNFVLDTRPSVPQPTAPISKIEVLPDGKLSWTPSNDPNPKDKIKYKVQIIPYSAGTKSENLVIEKEGIETTSISLTDAGWKPEEVTRTVGDNKVCSWKVLSIDNHGITSNWSNPAEFIFNAKNDSPNSVTKLNSPRDSEEISTVTLTWEAATDPDVSDTPDKIGYIVEMAQDEAFTKDMRTQEVGFGVTVLTVQDLTDNSPWYWRVTSKDDEGATGAKSRIGNFVYNRANDVPEVFNLTEPAQNQTFEGTPEGMPIAFSWEASSDIDPGDKLTYELIIARDQGFSIGVKEYENLREISFTPERNVFKTESMYYWKVKVSDSEGGLNWGSGSDTQPWSFTVRIPVPEPPVPTEGAPPGE